MLRKGGERHEGELQFSEKGCELRRFLTLLEAPGNLDVEDLSG